MKWSRRGKAINKSLTCCIDSDCLAGGSHRARKWLEGGEQVFQVRAWFRVGTGGLKGEQNGAHAFLQVRGEVKAVMTSKRRASKGLRLRFKIIRVVLIITVNELSVLSRLMLLFAYMRILLHLVRWQMMQ